MKDKKKPYLLILTASYPYDIASEDTFFQPEIKRYLGHFSKIVLVPQDIRGECLQIPEGVDVNISLAVGLQSIHRMQLLLRGLISLKFYYQLFKNPWLIRFPRFILRMAINRGRIAWMVKWFHRLNLPEGGNAPTIIYSFWLDMAVLAAGIYRSNNRQIKVVARAHGGDLYSERHNPALLPFQEETIGLLDFVGPDSLAGVEYLINKYPVFSNKINLARLGTDKPQVKNTSSNDGIIRMVSCAFLVEVKRINLIVRGIAELTNRLPMIEIEWTHFGDGPLMSEIVYLTQSILSKRVKCNFKGHVDTEYIFQWYKNQPVDVFINVSKSEGTPVSIMEAISCSIPVIATSVGGNREIVNDSLGVLISQDPTPEDISSAIAKICFNHDLNLSLRSGASEMWEENYNADYNYPLFRQTFLSLDDR